MKRKFNDRLEDYVNFPHFWLSEKCSGWFLRVFNKSNLYFSSHTQSPAFLSTSLCLCLHKKGEKFWLTLSSTSRRKKEKFKFVAVVSEFSFVGSRREHDKTNIEHILVLVPGKETSFSKNLYFWKISWKQQVRWKAKHRARATNHGLVCWLDKHQQLCNEVKPLFS